MKSILLLFTFLATCSFSLRAQKEIDQLLETLHNKDLYIAPIIVGTHITANPRKASRGKEKKPRRLFMVSSLPMDVQVLASKYSKKTLIKKLYPLLKDPERDLYVNALLFDLLDNVKLGKLSFMTRDQWINSGRARADNAYWDQFMKKEKYSN
jgi:hypothetical protein